MSIKPPLNLRSVKIHATWLDLRETELQTSTDIAATHSSLGGRAAVYLLKIARKRRRNHIKDGISSRPRHDHLRYEEKLMALHEHASQVASATSIDEIVTYTLDAMEFGVSFDYANVNMIEGNRLLCKGTRGMAEYAKPDPPLNRLGAMTRAVKGATTIRVADTRNEESYLDPTGTPSRKKPTMLSELAVPVIVNGKPVAILNVESTRLNAFTDEDQRLLETLASHVASELKRLEQVACTREPLEVLRDGGERYQPLLPVRRVLLNIVESIFDTMPSGDELTISAKESNFEIKFTHTGTVSTQEDLQNKGIDLGLANCRGAIEAHGGSIRIERAIGRETTLTVNLPVNAEIME
jgi:putative methionine-R-sulfoxide reductase with GAF domain